MTRSRPRVTDGPDAPCDARALASASAVNPNLERVQSALSAGAWLEQASSVAGADGLELDVALAAQQAIVGVHRARLEAAFPTGAGAAVAIIDVADVATPQRSFMALMQPIAAGVSSRCTRWVITS